MTRLGSWSRSTACSPIPSRTTCSPNCWHGTRCIWRSPTRFGVSPSSRPGPLPRTENPGAAVAIVQAANGGRQRFTRPAYCPHVRLGARDLPMSAAGAHALSVEALCITLLCRTCARTSRSLERCQASGSDRDHEPDGTTMPAKQELALPFIDFEHFALSIMFIHE